MTTRTTPSYGQRTRSLARTGRSVILPVLLLSLTGSAAYPRQPATGRLPAPQPTEAFRGHHAQILEHLGHLDAMATGLGAQDAGEQRATMGRVLGFLKDHIGPHAADEERVLYPVVQREAGARTRLTDVPIHEHRIIERWIGELERQEAASSPDAAEFARVTLHLVGLLRAHFEVEEEVLLPVLDATMTPEQFQREVADKMGH